MCCGPFVDFATVNISSPNTENLRILQEKNSLKKIKNTDNDVDIRGENEIKYKILDTVVKFILKKLMIGTYLIFIIFYMGAGQKNICK